MISEPPQIRNRRDMTATSSKATSSEVDFALILSHVIGSIKEDPAQLRNAVYELARAKLWKEAWERDPPLNLVEIRRLMLTLDSAVERVEAIHSMHDELKALESLDQLIEGREHRSNETSFEPREPLLIIDQAARQTSHADHPPTLLVTARRTSLNSTRAWRWSGLAPTLRGAIVVILGLTLCVVLGRQFGPFARRSPDPSTAVAQRDESIERNSVLPASQSPAQNALTVLRPQSPALPLPAVYGIYAVSGGQLQELGPLVGRVPDHRILMSTPINAPSRTVLPDGRVVFIIYSREVANNAPERMAVRVIARVTRAMTFTKGQASKANVQDSWTIRNVSYELRVAPLSENFEMLMIRPENSDFVFPAGRYGLVYKDQAYDFTVAGAITEAAQCLERVEAANGAFYSECRKP
jgi:hypothetical protein